MVVVCRSREPEATAREVEAMATGVLVGLEALAAQEIN